MTFLQLRIARLLSKAGSEGLVGRELRDALTWTAGYATFYSCLRTMAERRWLKRTSEVEPGRGPRKRYTLTQMGQKAHDRAMTLLGVS